METKLELLQRRYKPVSAPPNAETRTYTPEEQLRAQHPDYEVTSQDNRLVLQAPEEEFEADRGPQGTIREKYRPERIVYDPESQTVTETQYGLQTLVTPTRNLHVPQKIKETSYSLLTGEGTVRETPVDDTPPESQSSYRPAPKQYAINPQTGQRVNVSSRASQEELQKSGLIPSGTRSGELTGSEDYQVKSIQQNQAQRQYDYEKRLGETAGKVGLTVSSTKEGYLFTKPTILNRGGANVLSNGSSRNLNDGSESTRLYNRLGLSNINGSMADKKGKNISKISKGNQAIVSLFITQSPKINKAINFISKPINNVLDYYGELYKQSQPEQLITFKEAAAENYTGGTGAIHRANNNTIQLEPSLYKSMWEQKYKKSAFGAGVLTAGALGGAYLSSYLQGYTSLFRPSFYYHDIPQSIFFAKRALTEGLPTAQRTILTDPQKVAGIVGSFIGFGKGMLASSRFTKNVIYSGEEFFTQRALRNKFAITPEEAASLKKNSLTLTPEGYLKTVEGVTIPKTLGQLRGLENQIVPTVHTTLSPTLNYGSIIEAPPIESVGGFRRGLGAFNFYQSAPNVAPIQKKEGNMFVPTTYEKAGLNEQYVPNLYGGYIGLSNEPAYNEQVSLFGSKPRAFIFRQQKISPTPRKIIGGGIATTQKFQTQTPGTYIPVENVFSLTQEGQVVSSIGTPENPLFRIEENTAVSRPEYNIFYTKKKPVPEVLDNIFISGSRTRALRKIAKEAPNLVKITPKLVTIKNKNYARIMTVLQGENVALTGGTARKLITGQGRVRDIDIVTLGNEGKRLAEKVAAAYPKTYEVIRHEKYPEIYRLRDIKTRKVVADFDPLSMAEEGLINPETDIFDIGGVKLVKPEVQVKSKVTQILAGKERGTKQVQGIEQLTRKGIVEKTKAPNKFLQGTWDLFTQEKIKIGVKEAKLTQINEAADILGTSEETVKLNKDFMESQTRPTTSASRFARKQLSNLIFTSKPSRYKTSKLSEASPYISPSRSSRASSILSELSSAISASSAASFLGSSASSSPSQSSYGSSLSSDSSVSSSPSRSSSSSSSSSSGSYGSSSSSITRSPPRSPPFSPPSESRSKSSSILFGARQQAYDVFVKRKLAKANGSYQGRGYVKANDRPLSEGAATNQLMTILDKYANRSGYIKKAKEQLAVMPESLKTELLAKFRRAKRNPNILVEKTKYAIDSYEEKKAIPYEGQRIRKAKGFISSKRRGKNLKWL